MAQISCRWGGSGDGMERDDIGLIFSSTHRTDDPSHGAERKRRPELLAFAVGGQVRYDDNKPLAITTEYKIRTKTALRADAALYENAALQLSYGGNCWTWPLHIWGGFFQHSKVLWDEWWR